MTHQTGRNVRINGVLQPGRSVFTPTLPGPSMMLYISPSGIWSPLPPLDFTEAFNLAQLVGYQGA